MSSDTGESLHLRRCGELKQWALQKTPSRIPYLVWLWWLKSVGLVSRMLWVQIPSGAKFSDFVPGLESSSKTLPLIIAWVNYAKFERNTLVHHRLLV